MNVKITVEGHRELERQLRKLPGKVAIKVVRGAIRAGGRIVVKAAQARVPVRTGALKKSLGTRSRSYKGGAISAVMIGPRSGRKQRAQIERRGRAGRSTSTVSVNPAKYARLVAFGTKHSAAQPFLVPALEGNPAKVIAKVRDVVAKGVVREALKLRGKR